MELWFSEVKSTTCRAAPSPSSQTASMWCTTQREYVLCIHSLQISTDLASVVIKSIPSWLVLCICYDRCLFNTVKGHSTQPTRQPRTVFGRCTQSRFQGLNKLISGQRNPWSCIIWPRTTVTICGTPQGVISFITPLFQLIITDIYSIFFSQVDSWIHCLCLFTTSCSFRLEADDLPFRGDIRPVVQVKSSVHALMGFVNDAFAGNLGQLCNSLVYPEADTNFKH